MSASQSGEARANDRDRADVAFERRAGRASRAYDPVGRKAWPLGSEFGERPVFAVPVDGLLVRETAGPIELLYRLFEIVVALIGLSLSWPVMLIEALLIRLDSPGPALFFQSRTARSRIIRGHELKDRTNLRFPASGLDPDTSYWVPQAFPFFKFRTMYHDALKRFPELYDYSFQKQDFYSSFTKTGGETDPRVTRLGYYLRRLTIDELPNLWCVLIGQMRLVGPRPELPAVLHAYTSAEMYKFAVKPGITGLAQINGRGLLNRGETLKWDLEYVHTRTVWLDIKILFTTLWLVLTRRGAF